MRVRGRQVARQMAKLRSLAVAQVGCGICRIGCGICQISVRLTAAAPNRHRAAPLVPGATTPPVLRLSQAVIVSLPFSLRRRSRMRARPPWPRGESASRLLGPSASTL